MSRRPKLFLLLNQARESLFAWLNAQCLASLSVSVSQLAALWHLQRSGGATGAELARVLGNDKAAVSRLLRRLEAKALVERRRDPDDRRKQQVVLTPAGHGKASEGLAELARANALLTDGFDEAELRTVARFLTHAAALGETQGASR